MNTHQLWAATILIITFCISINTCIYLDGQAKVQAYETCMKHVKDVDKCRRP
jgi:hypothetical protein